MSDTPNEQHHTLIPFAPSEEEMWTRPPKEPKPQANDTEINAKYAQKESRIVVESNRQQLPSFVDALKKPGWMDYQPSYQRRRRWDVVKQSRLIESFIMNIPVPPLFMYEVEYAKNEVMDGQQRLNAVRRFYNNEFKLTGLEQWPELNKRNYSQLPSEIRKGLDRRSISYIILMKESASTSEEATMLRQQVFERLNTGGVNLSQQEVRNCVYQGALNNLLLELAKRPPFREVWGIPPFTDDEKDNPTTELLENKFYSKMTDVEAVLRFFALRHAKHYTRGMAGFLDLYMYRARLFSADDIKVLGLLFDKCLDLGSKVFGSLLLHPWDPMAKEWASKPQVAFADAVMVGLSRNLDHAKTLVSRRDKVLLATQELFDKHEKGTFTGSKNSKADVTNRIDLFDGMLKSVAAL